jgi:hypothetical protein
MSAIGAVPAATVTQVPQPSQPVKPEGKQAYRVPEAKQPHTSGQHKVDVEA